MRARGARLIGWGVLTTWASTVGCGRVGFESLSRTGEGIQTGGTDAGQGGTAHGNTGGTLSSGGTTSEAGAGGTGSGGAGTGATPNSGGALGTGGTTGGSAGADSGTGGAPSSSDGGGADAGPCVACASPTGLAFAGIERTAVMGGTGGAPVPDTCPENEVVIGYAGANDSTGSPVFLTKLGAICGKPTLSAATPYTITIAESRRLAVRGFAGDTPWETLCPPNQAVIGFGGNAGNYVFQLSLHCAPLVVTTTPSGHTLSVGPETTEPPVGGIAGATVPVARCPAGGVARGNPLRAGNWVDAFSLWCSTPTLTRGTGAACVTNADCDTGRCAGGSCAASSCVPAAGCTCASFDERDYAFCANAKTAAASEADCEAMGMRLARVDGAPEDGWLKSTSGVRGTSPLWIGGNSSAVANAWRWIDGTLFFLGGPSGGPQNGLYVGWETSHGEPVASPACITLPSVEGWGATGCATSHAYACERY